MCDCDQCSGSLADDGRTIDHALAEKVLNEINLAPEKFYMGTWLGFKNQEAEEEYLRLRTPVCGTTLCVAGWVEQITEGVVNPDDIAIRARDKLGLAETALFYTNEEVAKQVLEYMVDPSSTPQSVSAFQASLEKRSYR